MSVAQDLYRSERKTLGRQQFLAQRLAATRDLSAALAAPLSDEDQVAQAMDDASPTKWHLAHTTWFFEAFVLSGHAPDYRVFDDSFSFCFNSYYNTVGARQPRQRRGLLTRPSAHRVRAYRAHVDAALAALMQDELPAAALDLVELGVHHEQQHQELLLTDILSLFAASPLKPAYREPRAARAVDQPTPPLSWTKFDGGVFAIGHAGDGFAYDNEGPRHDALIRPFALADRCVTNAEWLEFMADGGYETPTLWLSDGWATVQAGGWSAPLYWEEADGDWAQMSLEGVRPIEASAPVSHVSFFEADAFARWSGRRLPTEFEWEVASEGRQSETRTLASNALRPLPAPPGEGLQQIFGDVWEHTASAYLPYPGFKTAPGAVGEYNGKFMCNQFVLRGGSCATPEHHIRRTYRNFFYPHQRWQFTGLRLASDL